MGSGGDPPCFIRGRSQTIHEGDPVIDLGEQLGSIEPMKPADTPRRATCHLFRTGGTGLWAVVERARQEEREEKLGPYRKFRVRDKGGLMNTFALVALSLSALGLVGCATTSTVITEPPGLFVVVDGKDFGKSPAKIESTGTTFGEYHLQIKDENGKVLHEQNLPKDVRIWGIFWPPYGVFYNMYRFHERYIVRSVKSSSGEATWLVITPP